MVDFAVTQIMIEIHNVASTNATSANWTWTDNDRSDCDPSLLTQEQGEASTRKLDGVRDACALEGGIYQLEDLFFKVAVKPPQGSFNWPLVRTVVECKTPERKMASPLQVYTCEPNTRNPERGSSDDGLVAKLFWVEETCKSEPDILKKVYYAESNEDVKEHVSDVVRYQVYTTSSAVIQRRLDIKTDRARVFHVSVFRKLNPIVTLVGDDFLRTWWAAVKYHLVLWKNGVYHRDVSPPNLMFDVKDGMIIGVLNDFDLASIEDSDGPTGTERTGTGPFMAMDLLQKQRKHGYEHDAESFIWVLIWISLRYDDGVLRKNNRPLDEWSKVHALLCRRKKWDFLADEKPRTQEAGVGHERNWQAAYACMQALCFFRTLVKYSRNPGQVLEVDAAFQRLLNEPIASFLR